MSTYRQWDFEFERKIDFDKDDIEKFITNSEGITIYEDSPPDLVSSFIEEEVDIYKNYLYISLPKAIRTGRSDEDFIEEFMSWFGELRRVLHQVDNDTVDIVRSRIYKINDSRVELIDEVSFGQGKKTLMRPSENEIEWIKESPIIGRHRYREVVDYFRVKHNFKARGITDMVPGDKHRYNETGPEASPGFDVEGLPSEEYLNYNYRGGVEERWTPEEDP